MIHNSVLNFFQLRQSRFGLVIVESFGKPTEKSGVERLKLRLRLRLRLREGEMKWNFCMNNQLPMLIS